MKRDDESKPMTDEALKGLLRELPREKASSDFTARTLARARKARPTEYEASPGLAPPTRARSGEPEARPLVPRAAVKPMLLVAAATLILAAAIPLLRDAFVPGAARDEPVRVAASDRSAELGALKREHERLAGDIERIRGLMQPAPEVVWLGGDDSVDLVLDLGRLSRARRDGNLGRRYDVMPAATGGAMQRP